MPLVAIIYLQTLEPLPGWRHNYRSYYCFTVIECYFGAIVFRFITEARGIVLFPLPLTGYTTRIGYFRLQTNFRDFIAVSAHK